MSLDRQRTESRQGKSILKGLVVVAMLIITAASGESGTQYGFQDEFVQLAMGVNTYDLPYGREERPRAEHVTFAGEPVTLLIAVNNVTSAPVSIQADWTRYLLLEIVPSVPNVTFVIRPREQPAGRGEHLIPSRRGLAADVEVRGPALPAGVYRIEVRLPPEVLPGRRGKNDALQRNVSLEVRDVISRPDQLNAYFHRAVRAQRTNRPRDAVELLKQLIAMSPASPAAYAEIGRALASSGDCAAASEAYERAIELGASGGSADERLNIEGAHLAGWARRLRAAAATCR